MCFRCLFSNRSKARVCRWLMVLGVGVAAVAASNHACALASTAAFSMFEAADLRWTQKLSVSVGGVPIHVRAFRSSVEPAGLAERYSTRTSHFQRILVSDGTIVLSGLLDEQHWLAEIRASSSGSSGRVSVMKLSGVNGAGTRPLQVYSWLPPQSRFIYSQADVNASAAQPARPSEQHVVEVAMSAQDVTAYLRQQLRSDGWVAEPIFADGRGIMSWRRRSSQLMTFTEALTARSSSLFVHLSP